MKTAGYLLLLVCLCCCGCGPQNGAHESEKDAAEAAWQHAQAFAADGRYEEALEQHVWFHNHALEVDPSYAGVRLSFALEHWVKLGEKYPLALTRLTEIRDRKTREILAGHGTWELFSDVESINKYLKDPEATVRLFKEIDAAQPELAAKVYEFADGVLVSAGEFALARKHLGDPMDRLEVARRNLDHGAAYARGKTNSEEAEWARRVFERLFESDVLRLIVVLEKTGDVERAKEVQARALTMHESRAIEEAL